MSRPASILAIALLAALAACATTDKTASADATAAADAPTASTDAAASATGATTTNSAMSGCNADAARSAIGQLASSDVIDQARMAAGAETARTLKPGQAVTMEFNGNRLNLDVDAGNKVTNVRCG